MAAIAGRKAYEAKLAQQYKHAASSPLTAFFFALIIVFNHKVLRKLLQPEPATPNPF
jgi:hypothetical protein